MRYEGPGPDSCHSSNSTFETIMIWIAIVLIISLFGGLFMQGRCWGSEGPGTKVNIHNTSDDLTHYNFVRFDHDILWFNGLSIQAGGGANPKEIDNIAKDRPPGIYRIEFWITGKFNFKKKFIIKPGIKEITIKIDPTDITPIAFECNCKENIIRTMNGPDIYELIPK